MQPSDISVSCPACGDAGSEIGGRLRLLRTLCISVLLTMPLFWNLHPLAQLAIASVLQFWPGAYFYKGAYKREKAERVAGMLGIKNVLCEVRPADKSDAVKALQARGKHVCFIGDGINDSPALACADIGVALGCGADIAISTADVMIVNSSMQSVQTVFDISAATMKNVRQNLIWAAVYNVICIPLAASGIINPSIAAAAMALSSNGVLLNALRLKKYEPRTI